MGIESEVPSAGVPPLEAGQDRPMSGKEGETVGLMRGLTEAQTKEVRALNEQQRPSRLLQRARLVKQVIKECFLIIESLFARGQRQRGSSFSWSVHVSAEHLAHGSFSGNLLLRAGRETIDRLLQVDDPPANLISQLKEMTKLEEALFNAHDSETRGRIAQSVRTTVAALSVGESILVPTCTKDHAMVMWVECTGMDTAGKKVFRIVQHNTGGGLNMYHDRRIDEKGKLVFQTALEFENISEDALCSPGSEFFHHLFDLREKKCDIAIGQLYGSIIPEIKGTKAPPKIGDADRLLWSHGQMGGSCTASCLVSLIRARSTPRQVKQFKEASRIDLLLKTYRHIKTRESPELTAVALETIKKLRSSYEAHGIAVSPELENMQRQLEEEARPFRLGAAKSHSFTGVGAGEKAGRLPTGHKPTSMTHKLGQAFKRIQDGLLNPEEYQKAVAALVELQAQISTLSPPTDLSPKELAQLNEVFDAIVLFLKEDPALTRDQIYLLSGVAALIRDLEETTNFRIPQGGRDFFETMDKKFNAIDKKPLVRNAQLDSSIQRYQDAFVKKQLEIKRWADILSSLEL